MMDYDKLARELCTLHTSGNCPNCAKIAQALERVALERAIEELESEGKKHYLVGLNVRHRIDALRKRLEELNATR